MRTFAFDKIGAVYVWIAIIVVFSIWVPGTFATTTTVKQILNSDSISGIAALAITIPFCAGVFDLSFGYVMSLTGVAAAHFLVSGWSVVPAVALALVIGLGMGVINGVVVVVMRIDSLIGTLATGSLMAAFITLTTQDIPINSPVLGGPFSDIGQVTIAGVSLSVVYCLVIALAMWYFLEHTASGRRLYATGFNRNAARLAGIRVNRLRFGALVTSGFVAGLAGWSWHRLPPAARPTRETTTCCPASPPCFLGPRSSTGGSTHGARSSPCCCSAPAPSVSASRARPPGPPACSWAWS